VIQSLSLGHCLSLPVLVTHLLVLVPEIFSDVFLSMLHHGLGPVKLTSPLTVVHTFLLVAGPIDNPHSVPVGLGTVCHEAFEVWHVNTVSFHHGVEILPEDHLGINVLRLHVAASNSHDTAVSGVIDMASHRCPLLDSFHMIEHQPGVLKITIGLHPLH